jgi:hypothetical protein
MAAIDKSRHAFGKSENLSVALDSGAVDAYDILFLDGDTDPKLGWVDASGAVRMLDTDCVVIVEGEDLPESGEIGKVYIYADEGYFWNGTEFKPVAKPADLTALEGQVTNLTTQMEQKVDIQTVQGMIEEYTSVGFEIVEF